MSLPYSAISFNDTPVIEGVKKGAVVQARGRLVFISFIFAAAYLAVVLRLVDLTLLQEKPSLQSADQNIKPLTRPLRGDIVDRNGVLLAASLKMASVYADATMVDDPARLATDLAKILTSQNREDIYTKLTSGRKFIWIQRNVTPKEEYAVNALGSPALNFQEEDRRIYPTENLMAHVVGYTDVDGIGIAGIEKSFNKALSSADHVVQLTIDSRLQNIMRRELYATLHKFSAKGACGMIMDVRTGEILAMVSLPDFDPHHPNDFSDESRFNRATLGVYEMGSTFKLFSTAAALDSGKVHFSSVYDAANPIQYGRFKISDYHAKKRAMTVPEIFMYSSNIGTARMAASLGPNALKAFYKKLGFFDQVALEIPERGAPLYPRPWHDIHTLTASFGHGIAVTPLHLVTATSALVNGGILLKPTIIKTKSLSLQAEGKRVVIAETSELVRKLMELVVQGGTGSNAKAEGYAVGGKTGTAEKNQGHGYIHNRVLSSFIGVYPIDNPRFAVLAMVDEPQPIPETHGFVTGGWTAAPVVAKVVSQMAPMYRITPEVDTGHNIMKEMSAYLKEYKEGKSVATAGTDH